MYLGYRHEATFSAYECQMSCTAVLWLHESGTAASRAANRYWHAGGKCSSMIQFANWTPLSPGCGMRRMYWSEVTNAVAADRLSLAFAVPI